MDTFVWCMNAVGDWLESHNGALIAIATIFLAVFTWRLWVSTNRLWKSGEKALRQTERAFVYIDGFKVELSLLADCADISAEVLKITGNPELYVTGFRIQPRWRNGGNTPTGNMSIDVNWRPPGDSLPIDFPYEYAYGVVGELGNIGNPLFIAPKAIEGSEFIEIPSRFSNEIINGGTPHIGYAPVMFIWGRAEYDDIFGQPHFTEWCYQIRFARRHGERLRADFTQWGKHNKTDETKDET